MTMKTTTPDVAQQVIQLALSTWTSRNTAVTAFFDKYPDTAYLSEVAPGRNRAIYLLGHLAATNDGLLPLFGLGARLYPELETVFSKSPDKAFDILPTLPELKQRWEAINATLTGHFNNMSPEEWLGRHTAVSEEDFAKEPHRNKLNVLLGRTNHQSYHLGQLNLLPVPSPVIQH